MSINSDDIRIGNLQAEHLSARVLDSYYTRANGNLSIAAYTSETYPIYQNSVETTQMSYKEFETRLNDFEGLINLLNNTVLHLMMEIKDLKNKYE